MNDLLQFVKVLFYLEFFAIKKRLAFSLTSLGTLKYD